MQWWIILQIVFSGTSWKLSDLSWILLSLQVNQENSKWSLDNVSGHALTIWLKLPVGGTCVGNTEVVGVGIKVGGAAGK